MKRLLALFVLCLAGCSAEVAAEFPPEPQPEPAPPSVEVKDFVELKINGLFVESMNAWLHENPGKEIVAFDLIYANNSYWAIIHFKPGSGRYQRVVEIDGNIYDFQKYINEKLCKVVAFSVNPTGENLYIVCIEEE